MIVYNMSNFFICGVYKVRSTNELKQNAIYAYNKDHEVLQYAALHPVSVIILNNSFYQIIEAN